MANQKPKVIVACPIFERAWIFPKWIAALEAQKADVDLSVVFCLTKGSDGTEKLIEDAKARFPITVCEFSGGIEDHSRDWTDADRVATIASKRNRLLEAVKATEGEYVLMLDSDVLPGAGGVKTLIETLKYDGLDAVCPKVWVWNAFFVAAKYTHGKLAFLPRRERGVHPVDMVTSSACLMVKRLADDNAVRYGVALRGRDFGWAPGHEVNGWTASECVFWSKQAKAKSYRLGVNCNVTFDHRMSSEKV